MKRNMLRNLVLIGSISCIISSLLIGSCTPTDIESNTPSIHEKISSQLVEQINLRKAQIADPDPERLKLMEDMGMNLENIGIQRIFIHLNLALSPTQIEELQSLGITLYLDSWIPPVGVHPTGFIIADMPIDMLEVLANKIYIVRLETAEHLIQPTNIRLPQ